MWSSPTVPHSALVWCIGPLHTLQSPSFLSAPWDKQVREHAAGSTQASLSYHEGFAV